jgi:trehalose synthase
MNDYKNLLVKVLFIPLLIFYVFILPVNSKGEEVYKYVKWLEEQSMLHDAIELSKYVSGSKIQWDNPYAEPQTEKALKKASVWFTAYPSSIITKPGETILQALGNEDLWKLFDNLGIDAMHTGPMKKAGAIKGQKFTSTIDGWFDRISLNIDANFGNDEEYKRLVKTAKKYGKIIIGDIIPGHTGKGADFRLAEMGYKDYPGLYTMVEIKKEHWSLLPEVPAGEDCVNLTSGIVNKLKEEGYIPGELQRVLYSVPGRPPLTGWDATKTVIGFDGRERRWVYLHYFKRGQPTLNWLDPTFAANRLIAGDLIKTKLIFGAEIVRLDANPFLGIETKSGSTKAWSEGHPLSIVASNYIAWMMRKLGGWSFQELNLRMEDIKAFSQFGPDLSYDFITRPAYDHALLTGDASFLRLCLKLMRSKDINIKPIQLIHALQNHDEITYELVHFLEHADDLFSYKGGKITGGKLRKMIIDQMHSLAISGSPYNRLSGNGLCTTYVGLCTAGLGIKDPYSMSAENVNLVKKGHMLLAIYNAMQPGVFAISGWDLVGALPLKVENIQELVVDGDYRWINRGAYDLMGLNPKASISAGGIPAAKTLYGTLPNQLKDPNSFAMFLKNILGMRKRYKIHLSEQIAIPNVENDSILLLVHRLPENMGIEITAINFARKNVIETVRLDVLNESKGINAPLNLLTNKTESEFLSTGAFRLDFKPLECKVLLFSTKRSI